jgi:hypothetical protein
MTTLTLPGLSTGARTAADLAPRERHLIGRITRLASLNDFQVSADDLRVLDDLTLAGLVQAHRHGGCVTYTLSVEGHALVKAARNICRGCPNGEVCG